MVAIEIHAKDKARTDFVSRNGQYQFNVMPVGLCNAPATFERFMELFLAGLQWDICLIYLDDGIQSIVRQLYNSPTAR